MNFDAEMATLVQRYFKDTTGWDADINDLLMEPRHKRVWDWWRAMCYYRVKDNYPSIEEAPPGLPWVGVTDDTVSSEYKWVNGRYELIQQMTRETAKSIYGE